MLRSTAHVATDRPERYAKQLVSHLGHKAAAEHTGSGCATITFRSGACSLRSSQGVLVLVVEAADLDALGGVQDVVTRHLLRFAAHEELHVDWTGSRR
ncbi:DUF2218 domain-containing protein [Nonomuraea sp. WAC 01424]|uniref:DUF2218 domain-containing protein n=1 Tax=Nonomuraea sp. WAC 01424 TaxID=2203200 RepID=UPI000F76A185|nr:DUF2218 domain-containing protein [Nonomuraea sp. WAC 01424]RSN15594.1 DUF2218 domain-containing protein [Nonomuraea sp. WAC 01424]